ncbi:MAG: nitrogen fixation protein NifQ [Terracidiphilus sp.]|nr:nitrogen fixation protein NifQ [Terracidiphilus sp.]
MTTDAMYILLNRSLAPACDPFDGHVLACVFAIAAEESAADRSLAQALGVSGKSLRGVIAQYFPHALDHLIAFGLDSELVVEDEEQSLRMLLQRSRSTSGPLSSLLAAIVARRAMQSNHLWQDLGLTNRSELSALMQRHFAPLAVRNNQDMRWKKFFYRMICRDDSYRLCAAPSCSECCDFNVCFGDESGESRLARVRWQVETLVPIQINASSDV